MKKKIVSVADFTRFPGGRLKKDGPFSGEEFRDEILIPAMETSDCVVVNIDSVSGYASSFLEEVFGGVVRKNVYPPNEIAKKLDVYSSDPVFSGFVSDAKNYFNSALHSALGSKIK